MFEGDGAVSSAAVEALDAAHAEVCAAQRRLLGLIVQAERAEAWREDGARDLAHWLGMRYGISNWKAHRWIAAAHALDGLPLISEAFARGELGIDKVVELTRFATPASEVGLISWAAGVSCGAIRHRGDLAARISTQVLTEVEATRSLSWWFFDEGRRFGLEAELPAAQGAIVARALQRMADGVPSMPDEQQRSFIFARRADALVALCSAKVAADADPDRATVVVHAQAQALVSGTGGCEIEDGPVIASQTVQRLLCNARSQVVLEDARANVLGLGRMSREPSAWMARQVRHRDRECRFPGCGTRAFTEAHHIVFWGRGGRTELENLVLICSFHHRLVHEYGWSMRREDDGTIGWCRPDGTRYRAGPSPGSTPPDDVDDALPLAVAG